MTRAFSSRPIALVGETLQRPWKESFKRECLPGSIFFLSLVSAFTVLFLAVSACSVSKLARQPQVGVYHQVKAGETLHGIAQSYKVKIKDLIDANHLADPAKLEANAVLFIPGAQEAIDGAIPGAKTQPSADRPVPGDGHPPVRVAPKGQLPPETAPKGDRKPGAEPPAKQEAKGRTDIKPLLEEIIPADKSRFIWPVNGEVRSGFGPQPGGMFNNGIRIAANEGATVVASGDGTVIFSSTLKGFGETVILRHEDNFATVYTNLGRRFVKVSDQVRKGEQIAVVGNPDKLGKATLAFEIRLKGKPQNPLGYLP